MNEGWICPRCGKVNAPNVKACDCKNDEELKEQSIIEELKKHFNNSKDIPQRLMPIISYCPDYYPDWTYLPYGYYHPRHTLTSGTCDDYIK